MPLTRDDDIADLLQNARTIAMVGASDRPDRAKPLLRRQLALTERIHGPGRRESATALDRLAEALARLGKTAEAAALRVKAAEIRKKLCDEC